MGRHRRSEADVLQAVEQYEHLVRVLHTHRPGDRSGLCMICGIGWPCLQVHLTVLYGQIEVIFGAKKAKVLTTIPKGYSKNLFEDFTTGEELDGLYAYLQEEKKRNGWTPRITIADWMKIGPGHAILIEPDGRAIASPVWSEPACLEPFGNLYDSSATELWSQFPYKQNHMNKYLERTMMVID